MSFLGGELRFGETVSGHAPRRLFLMADFWADMQRQRFSDELGGNTACFEVQRIANAEGKAARGTAGKKGNVHRSPKRLRDVPDRVRPANYGGSGEIISPDAFSAFCLFCLFCLYCVLVICAERDYSGFSGGRSLLSGGEAEAFGALWPRSMRQGWGCLMSTIYDFEKKVRK